MLTHAEFGMAGLPVLMAPCWRVTGVQHISLTFVCAATSTLGHLGAAPAALRLRAPVAAAAAGSADCTEIQNSRTAHSSMTASGIRLMHHVVYCGSLHCIFARCCHVYLQSVQLAPRTCSQLLLPLNWASQASSPQHTSGKQAGSSPVKPSTALPLLHPPQAQAQPC